MVQAVQLGLVDLDWICLWIQEERRLSQFVAGVMQSVPKLTGFTGNV